MRRALIVSRVLVASALASAVVAGPWAGRVDAAGARTTTTTLPAEVTVPAALDPTGAADVTDALNQFFGRLGEGATVIFPAGARYRVDGGLYLARLRDVLIEGNGAALITRVDGSQLQPTRRAQRRAWPRLRRHVTVINSDRVTVRDLTVVGPNADADYTEELEGQAGFAVIRSTGITLEGVTVRSVHGDGVYVVGRSDAITVRDSRFARIGRQGVALVGATNTVIAGNEFDGIARSVLDIEPPGRADVGPVRFSGNQVGDYGNFLLAASGGGDGVRDVTVRNNRITGGNGISVFAGIDRVVRKGLVIRDNVSTAEGSPDDREGREGIIQITQYTDVRITGNSMPVQPGAPVIGLDRVCDPEIADNRWLGAGDEVVVAGECGAGPSPTTRPGGTGPADGRDRPARRTDRSDGVPGWLLALVGVAAGAVITLVMLRLRDRGGPSGGSGPVGPPESELR